MPKGEQAVLEAPKNRQTSVANVDNRLSAAELRKEIHQSGICYVALEMAKTGRRPVYNEETEEVEMQNMSEAAHVDLVKFFANKVIAHAKDIPTADDKAVHDKWTAIAASAEVV